MSLDTDEADAAPDEHSLVERPWKGILVAAAGAAWLLVPQGTTAGALVGLLASETTAM